MGTAMDKEISILGNDTMQRKIHTIRGVQVMIDRDLAELYGVETRAVNQAVKRNIKRFPDEFMFQLTEPECESLISQIVISKEKRGGHRKAPFVFTEQGVSMLSAVLKSDSAIKMSIRIIKVFVEMRRVIANNTLILQRLDIVEQKQLETDHKFEQVFNAIESKNIKPSEGIFFDGQVYDAYIFASDLIKSAKKSIVLIDNYVDDTVLTLLSKRKKGCSAKIYTQSISKQLKLDLKKHNEQYPVIEIELFKSSHDRFLILDQEDIYHIGASLKDLGKKWFAFSKFEKGAVDVLVRLEG